MTKNPLSALRATSPTRRTRPFCRYRDVSPVSAGESTPKEEAKFVFARKRSEAGSTARPPFGAIMRATSPVSSGESTPGRVEVYGAYFPFFFRGIAAALRASQ